MLVKSSEKKENGEESLPGGTSQTTRTKGTLQGGKLKEKMKGWAMGGMQRRGKSVKNLKRNMVILVLEDKAFTEEMTNRTKKRHTR